MSYDSWKAHNPQDEFLGPDPDDQDDEPELTEAGQQELDNLKELCRLLTWICADLDRAQACPTNEGKREILRQILSKLDKDSGLKA